MKILWIADKYLDTSVDSVTWVETCRELMRMGHEIRLFAGFRKEKKPFGLNGAIHYLPSVKKSGLGTPTFDAALFFYLSAEILRTKPDAVIVHPFSFFPVLPFVLLRRAGLLRTCFVMDVRTLPVTSTGAVARIRDLFFRIGLKGADRLFDGMTVITPFMRRFVQEKYRLTRRDIGVWTSGVSPERFGAPSALKGAGEKRRREWGLIGKFVVMYHGVLTHNRGLFEAIRAMGIVREKIPEAVLVLVGNGGSRAALERLVYSLGLGKNVMIRGPFAYEKMPEIVSMADVGLLPFPDLIWWRVSSPIKLMEFLAMEKPVIVTDIEAHRDVLSGEEAACFVRQSRPEDLAGGILEAYAARKKLKAAGKRNRALVQSRYTWERQAAHLFDYLERMC